MPPPRVGFSAALLLSAGCVSGPGTPRRSRSSLNRRRQLRTPVPAPEPAPDPIAVLIAASDKHFEAGRKKNWLSVTSSAPRPSSIAHSTRCLNPLTARGASPRLREQFENLVDRISALEDGLADGRRRRETNRNRRRSTSCSRSGPFEPAAPSPHRRDRAGRPRTHAPRHSDSVKRPRAPLCRAVSGPAARIYDGGPSRSVQYLPMIQATFRAEGVAARPCLHSTDRERFQELSALSRASARGIWQFMLGTGQNRGFVQTGTSTSAPTRKGDARRREYLKTLYGMFEDWHFALARYNGGPGRVQGAVTAAERTISGQLTCVDPVICRARRVTTSR